MNKLSYFPLSLIILFPIKCLLAYCLAVYYGHVEPVFPYISDTGTLTPEAAYFSLLLSIEAVIVGIVSWIRYQQLNYVCTANITKSNITEDNRNLILRYNKYAVILAAFVVIGQIGIASFRSTENLVQHGLAAFPVFAFTPIIFLLHTRISYILIPAKVNTLTVARIRLMTAIFVIISEIVCGVLAVWASVHYITTGPVSELLGVMRLQWDSTKGGYVLHCVSSVFEWLFVLLMIPFFATYVTEFSEIKSHNGYFIYKNTNHINCNNNI